MNKETTKHAPPILAISVDKGGEGKTTICANTARGLASKGYNVLAVDGDQQANLTTTLLGSIPDITLFNTLSDNSIPLPIVKAGDNLDVVPASHKMFGIGFRMISSMYSAAAEGKPAYDCRLVLRALLQPLIGQYDWILIDCPPSDNLLMMNALYCASHVLIVTKPERFGIEGVQNFIQILGEMKHGPRPDIRLAGILINNFETGSVGHEKGEAALRAWAKDLVFKVHIRHSRPIYNSVKAFKDVFLYSPKSNGAIDIQAFIDELITKVL